MTIRAGGALAALVLAVSACASAADESAADRADGDTTTTTELEPTTTTEAEPSTERVERLWTLAVLADDGSAQISEVIDYDFGGNERHGIFRIVPDLSPDAPITVDSPDAPDAIQVTPDVVNGRDGANIRIGDPNVTVTGRHRYRIEYPLPGVARGTTLDWGAIGTAWEVGIEEAEIHVVAPFELLDATCSVGVIGSQGGCDVTEVAPGHLMTTVHGVDSGEGLSIESRTGGGLASAPAAPQPPATTSSSASPTPV